MSHNLIHSYIQKKIGIDHEHFINSSNINIGKKIVEIIYNNPTRRTKKLIMILRNYQIKQLNIDIVAYCVRKLNLYLIKILLI